MTLEEELDTHGLDNSCRFALGTRPLRVTNKDPQDDKQEPLLPKGFHIFKPIFIIEAERQDFIESSIKKAFSRGTCNQKPFSPVRIATKR